MNEEEYNHVYDCLESDYSYLSKKYSKEIRNPVTFFAMLLDIVIRHMMICAPNKHGVMEVIGEVLKHVEERDE